MYTVYTNFLKMANINKQCQLPMYFKARFLKSINITDTIHRYYENRILNEATTNH